MCLRKCFAKATKVTDDDPRLYCHIWRKREAWCLAPLAVDIVEEGVEQVHHLLVVRAPVDEFIQRERAVAWGTFTILP